MRTGGDTGAATTLTALSGTTILANNSNGIGAWYEIDAPVRVQGFRDEQLTPEERNLVLPCQNYSSPLLPSHDGAAVLELATDVVDGTCKAFYASGSTSGSGDAAGVSTTARYDVINLKSRKCLDLAGRRVENGTPIPQWTCAGLAAQEWGAVSRGTGQYALANAKSKTCLDVPNGNISVDPGDRVQLWTCNGTGAQTWVPSAVDRSADLLRAKNNPALCLDIPNGAVADGVSAQVVACSGAGAQLWYLKARG